MMEHGGVYCHYFNSRKTTHIIASNLPDVKVRQLKGHELIVKVRFGVFHLISLLFVN
jgi:DNA repair protein REV1